MPTEYTVESMLKMEDRQAKLTARRAQLLDDLDKFDPSDHVSANKFEHLLNEMYDEVNVCGIMYQSGRLLREVDPVAFQQAYLNYCSSVDNHAFEEYQDLLSEIESVEAELDNVNDIVLDLEEI